MSQNIFLDPTVSAAPTLTPGSVGNGTLTVNKLTHFTIDQTYTAIATSTDPFTVFNIIGSVDGPVGVAVVGDEFIDQDSKVFLTINQGPILFQVGDTFEFGVEQGTDVAQINIDIYDELPQKNFGVGVIGENKGDHNIRFNELEAAASRVIQDLTFESLALGPDGNAITIEYIEGTQLTAASRVIQDLTYTANFPGVPGNNVSIEYIESIPNTPASAIIQDISFSSKLAGTSGNVTSIEYIAGGTAGSEVVTITGDKITVQIEDGVSTADQIRIAIGSNPPSFALIDGFSTGDGTEVQAVQAETFLTGGLDSSGEAGSEVVTVVGNNITIQLENGVSTAQNILDALIANPSVLGVISPSITGTAGTTQVSPLAAVNLQGGTDLVGDPGNEIVTVNGDEIQVTFISGQSTSAQIKAALDGSSAASLISTTLSGSGQQETTDIDAIAAGLIANGEYFQLFSANDTRVVSFYYRIDGIDAAPGNPDEVPIDILSTDDINTVSIKTAATIDSEPEWSVGNPAAQTYRVVNSDVGPSIGYANFNVGLSTSSDGFPTTKIFEGNDIGGEAQTSSVSRSSLAGGLGNGTFSFNTQELTDAGNFVEGNAGILITELNNQGNETTQGNTSKRGKLSLDDSESTNLSGDSVENVQKTINNLIQDKKVLLYIDNSERTLWSDPAGTLTVNDNIVIFFSETGISNTILASNFPQTLVSGESLWVTVDRFNSIDISVTKGTMVPTGENVFRLVTRLGNNLLWWDNTFHKEGDIIRVGEGAGTNIFPNGIFFGDPDTDGTWRLRQVGSEFFMDYRVGGVYEERNKYEG